MRVLFPLFFNYIVGEDNALMGEDSEEQEEHGDTEGMTLTAAERKQHESENARVERENAAYDSLKETQPIQVADGFVTFTRHFKYL